LPSIPRSAAKSARRDRRLSSARCCGCERPPIGVAAVCEEMLRGGVEPSQPKFELQRLQHGTGAGRHGTRRSRQSRVRKLWGRYGQNLSKGGTSMIRPHSVARWVILALTGVILAVGYVYAQQPAPQTVPPNPVSDGDRGSQSGTTRADQLHAGSHHGVVRVADGALIGRKARRRTGTQRSAQRALRSERPPAPGCHDGPDKTIQEGVRVKLTAGVTWSGWRR